MAQECFDKGYPLVEKQISLAYPLFDREKEADLVEMTEALTAKFDARNGNSYYQDLLK
ncbi:Undefined function [Listeria monocytogenes]|nr:Undefined function [Listeria monocytogenes]